MVFQHLFNKPSIEEVSVEEAKAKQKAGAVIVDVRESHEWREGYIPGAKLIPLGSLAKCAQELDPSKEIIPLFLFIACAIFNIHVGATCTQSTIG